MDILVHPDSDNAKRILRALDEFGFGSLGLKVEDFTAPDKVVQLGVAAVRIDIVTSLSHRILFVLSFPRAMSSQSLLSWTALDPALCISIH